MTHCKLDTDFQKLHLILPGISIRRADSLAIPEKVTAVWAHNEAGVPADHHGRLQRLLPLADRIEGTRVSLDLKCIN